MVAKGKGDNLEVLLKRFDSFLLFIGGGAIRQLRSVCFFSVAGGCQLFGLFR